MSDIRTPTSPSFLRPPPNFGRPIIQHVDTFVSGINQWSSRLYLNPDEAYRQSRQQQSAMRRDPVIMQPLRERQLATALLEWQIVPEDKSNQDQKDACKIITKWFQNIPNFLKLRMALLEAIWFGRYAVELDYAWASRSLDQPEMIVNGWVPHHGDKLAFEHETGKVGIYTRNLSTGKDVRFSYESRVQMLEPWERQRLVVHKHEIEDGEFYEPETAGAIHGIGLRTRLYWPWWIKQNYGQWLTDYMERTGLGLTIWYYEAGNKTDEEATRRAAEEFTGQTVVLAPFPIGTERPIKRYERIEPSTGGASFFKEVMEDMMGKQIRGMIVGQESTSQSVSTGLGSEIAKVQQKTFENIIRFDAQNLSETISQELLPVLVKWKLGDLSWKPRFELVLDEQDPKAMLDAVSAFIGMGGQVGERQVREIVGLPEPDPGDKILGQSAGGFGGAPGGMPGGPDHGDIIGEAPGEGQPPEAEEQPEGPREGFIPLEQIQMTRGGDPLQFAQGVHAPKGGVTIKGTFFKGGEFIPASMVAQASPEERAKLQPTRQGYEAVSRTERQETDAKGKTKAVGHYEHSGNSGELPEQLAERVKSLRLPPAWTGVQVSADPTSPLQAIGYDEKGRVQYRYSDAHTKSQAAEKFKRVKAFVEKLPKIRGRIAKDLHGPDGPDREAAAVLFLIDKTGFRVGSDRDTGADKKAFGATTLQSSHVKVNGDSVTFSFVGKKGVNIKQTVKDHALASVIAPRAKGGNLFHVADTQVRDYLHRIAGKFKVKDFRTATAADTAIGAIEHMVAPKTDKEFKMKRAEVGKIVSDKLGNTPTVALASYIPPEVFGSWQANLMKATGDSESLSKRTAMPKRKIAKPNAAKTGGTHQKQGSIQTMMT